jgi:hypothetical protein
LIAAGDGHSDIDVLEALDSAARCSAGLWSSHAAGARGGRECFELLKEYRNGAVSYL